MKTLMVAVCALASVSAFAADLVMTDKVLKATGGFVVKPGTQSGEIVYVNCQKSAAKEWIVESVAYFKEITRCKVALEDGTFDIAHVAKRGNITIYVIDDPNLPALLCAPEEPWAAVNVARLKSDKQAFFAARVKKELSRAVAMISGAAFSQYKNTLLVPIKNAEDLDHHVDHRIPVDVISRFAPYAKEFGVTGEFKTTYRMACRQGWASAPTNDYQKVIWEEEHAKPTNPMRIKFDPKKGE